MIKNQELSTELLKLISDNEETIIPYDKIKIEDMKKNMRYKKYSIQNKKSISDTLFLSAILFTLTKFIYDKDILVTKLKEGSQNKFNKLIISSSIDTNITVKDYLNQMENSMAKIEQYDSNIFDEIKEQLDLNLSHFQYYYQEDSEGGDHCSNLPESNFTVLINEVNESEIKIKIFYNSNLYNEKTVQLFYNSLLIILKEFKNEHKLLKDIGIGLRIDEIIKKEVDKFIEPEQFLLNEWFEKVVSQNRDKIALITSDRSLTFDELNREANKIANTLLKKGLNIENRVIIKFEKGINLVIAIFGVMKAGGTFIIVSPDDPTQRIELIKKDTDAKYIIDRDNIDNFKTSSDENPKINLKPDDMFCISYTSGSTGKPKGIMVTHKSISYKLRISEYDIITSDDRYLLVTQPIFNLFVKDLFIFLLKGLIVVLPKEEILQNPLKLLNFREKTKFNIITMTPSRLISFLDDENFSNIMKDMKVIILGGERITKQLLVKIKEGSDALVINLYGFCEDSGNCNVNVISNCEDISIGKPVLNTVEKIMDVDGNPLPNGITGELCVGGFGITKGYWNNKKLTEEKYTTVDSIPFFKTGDLAKYDENGNYSIIGRLDNQIKLRGQRIDPGEIENNVPEDIGVEKTIVTVNNKNDNQFLVLYFTTKSKFLKSDEINKLKEDIEKNLKTKLPQYMVPQVYVYLGEFPKTPTGKISVKDLKNYDDSVNEIIKPSDGLEQELFDICAEILGHTNFGVVNNLLSIGFTSLSLIRLLGKVFEEYHVSISSLDVIKNSYSISDIAKKIKVLKKIENVKNDILEKYPLSPNLYSYYKNVVKPQTPESKSFNNPVYLDFSDFDVFKLKDALYENIKLNNYIKTSFVLDEGKIYQKRNDDLSVNIKIHEKELNDDIKKNFVKPFNIFEPPLFRLELYYHNGKVSLLFDIHHILMDAYSIDMFFNDLIKLYFDKKIIKEYDYFDYSLEYSKIIKKSAYSIKDSLKLFQLFLFGIFRIIKVWHDKINHSSSKIQIENIFFDEETVLNFCKKSDISADEFFLSLVTLSLAKLFDMRKIKLEFAFHGRTDIKYSQTFGYFSYTVPLFLNVNFNMYIQNYFSHVKKMKNKAILDSIDLMKDPQQYLKEEYCHLKFLDTIHNKFKFLFKQSSIKVLYNHVENYEVGTYSQLSEYDGNESNNFNGNILNFTVSNMKTNFILTVLYNSINEDDFVEYIESLFYKIIENPSKKLVHLI